MAATCLFCGIEEKNFKPPPDIEFICGSCVQMFLSATHEQARNAYKKAIKGQYHNKAKALEIFFSEEVLNGEQQETAKDRSGLERERPLRTSRSARNKKRA